MMGCPTQINFVANLSYWPGIYYFSLGELSNDFLSIKMYEMRQSNGAKEYYSVKIYFFSFAENDNVGDLESNQL
jgi:hypothetical protein